MFGTVGCNWFTKADDDHSKVIYDFFTCDTTGVEKSVFGRYEPIGYGFTAKNVSGKPLDYRRVDWSETLFDVSCSADIDSIMPGANSEFTPQAYGDHVLLPGEQLEQTLIYPPPTYLPEGRCKAVFSLRFQFYPLDGKKYKFKGTSKTVKFTILDE